MGRDAITGLAVLAASLALFWGTLGLERHPLVPVGPGFYPRIVLGISAAFALWLVIADVVSRRGRPVVPVEPALERTNRGTGTQPERARANYNLVAVAFGPSR